MKNLMWQQLDRVQTESQKCKIRKIATDRRLGRGGSPRLFPFSLPILSRRFPIPPAFLHYLKGADYMANFSPGWNFSLVSRAEISPRPPEQIFLKRRLPLHGENVSPGWDFQPGLKLRKTSCNRIKISARAEKWAWVCSVIVFSAKQDGGLPLFTAILNFTRAETSHVIATKFQPGGRA